MPRENSLSDSEGRSLTPDLEDEEEAQMAASPVSSPTQLPPQAAPRVVQAPSLLSPAERSILSRLRSPTNRTQASVKSPATRGTAQASIRSPTTHKRHPWAGLTPTEKFRAVARKVMALHRGTSYLIGKGRVGAEPGVNPRRASADILYNNIRQDCVIEVVDYSAVRSKFHRLTNAEFVSFLDDEKGKRQPWSKVRWINIGGLSWDVIKAVSIKYDLHPLALEDIFHSRSQNRSKADYYPKHLFLRVLCHEFVKGGHSKSAPHSTLTGEPRSESPASFQAGDDEEKDEDRMHDHEFSNGGIPKKRRGLIPNMLLSKSQQDVESNTGSRSSLARLMAGGAATRQTQSEQEVTLDALKQGERVPVKVSPMFVFLLRDGTVISIHGASNLEMTLPIGQRLRQTDTGLRTSADPSLLVHAILDLIVDNALEVIDEYHTKINKFERSILLKPDVKTVEYLHILSGDLILHKRTMGPIRTLIYGLRRYDLDRCVALVDMSDPANADKKVVGFMSHKSKIYLADVMDHMEYILTSLDMFASVTENLVSYTFNLASYEMNQTMRLLTIATIIFLPLTLLTGYFGMNFHVMFSVDQHTDLFFWEIALPLMAVLVPLFMWQEIKAAFRRLQKKMTTKKAVKTIKQS